MRALVPLGALPVLIKVQLNAVTSVSVVTENVPLPKARLLVGRMRIVSAETGPVVATKPLPSPVSIRSCPSGSSSVSVSPGPAEISQMSSGVKKPPTLTP